MYPHYYVCKEEKHVLYTNTYIHIYVPSPHGTSTFSSMYLRKKYFIHSSSLFDVSSVNSRKSFKTFAFKGTSMYTNLFRNCCGNFLTACNTLRNFNPSKSWLMADSRFHTISHVTIKLQQCALCWYR